MNKYSENFDLIWELGGHWRKDIKLEKSKFDKCYKLASKVHHDQQRDEGTPYMTHIDDILKIYIEELGESNYTDLSVIALHDVLEDSDVTKQDLYKLTDDEDIVEMVEALTKEDGMSTEAYIERMKNFHYPYLVIGIKLADRLANLRSLNNIIETHPDKVKRKVNETEKHYLNLAKQYNFDLFVMIKDELATLNKNIK